MKIIAILCAICGFLCAEHYNGFLENFYDELRALSLSQEQEKSLKIIIKKHHIFLREWYERSRKNNDEILRDFATSALESNSHGFIKDTNLGAERAIAEHKFMLGVYEILDKNQRKIFGENLKKKSQIKICKNC